MLAGLFFSSDVVRRIFSRASASAHEPRYRNAAGSGLLEHGDAHSFLHIRLTLVNSEHE
jgi:hypothetical protein